VLLLRNALRLCGDVETVLLYWEAGSLVTTLWLCKAPAQNFYQFGNKSSFCLVQWACACNLALLQAQYLFEGQRCTNFTLWTDERKISRELATSCKAAVEAFIKITKASHDTLTKSLMGDLMGCNGGYLVNGWIQEDAGRNAWPTTRWICIGLSYRCVRFFVWLWLVWAMCFIYCTLIASCVKLCFCLCFFNCV
jgi:hypothetical protein